MPRASSTRRSVASGSINTSRGNRSQAGPSSSRRRAADSADEEEDSELRSEPTRIASGSSRLADARAEEEVDHQSDEVNPADQIRNALEDWETKTHPFMGSDCAMVTQSLLQDGSAVRVGIETVLSIIADCAEKRAELEFVDDEAGMRHDEVLQDLDNDTCDLIDLRSKYALRQTVLKEMHDNVSGGDEYAHASKVLVEQSKEVIDAYNKKTTRQRLKGQDDYTSFRTKIWTAISDEVMPSITDFIPAEPGDEVDAEEDDEGSDLEIRGTVLSFKCPLSLRLMEDPVKSTICGHHYERRAIQDFLASSSSSSSTNRPASVSCPVTSCSAKITKNNLEEDAEFKKQAKTYARRQEARSQKRKNTQAPPAMLD